MFRKIKSLKNNKHSSYKLVLFLLFLLITPVTLSFIVLLFYSLNESDENIQTQFTSYVDTQIEDTENLLYSINNFMIDAITNNSHINAIRDAEDTLTINIEAREFGDELRNERLKFGNNFNFYFWSDDVAISSFEEAYSYNDSVELIEYVEKLREDEFEKTNSFNWTMVKTENSNPYILQSFKVENDYIYCWISLNFLFESISDSQSLGFEILDNDLVPVSESEEYINIKFEKMNELVKVENEYFYPKHLDYTDVNLVFINKALIDLGVLYVPLILILLLMIITLAISIYTLLYYKNNIEKPLKKIEDYIFDYSVIKNEKRKSGFVQISNAAAAFDDLNEKLNKLRIDMYEEKLNHAKTELQFYQLQIKPHFLVNCYSIIFAMAQKKDYTSIQNLCLKLSNYMRSHFVNCLDLVTLKSEFTSVIDYLDIQNIRHRTNAVLTDNVNEDLWECKIPHMLLMTFVENSIKHYKSFDEELVIEMDIEPVSVDDKEMLQIHIIDNGPGIQKEINYTYIESLSESVYEESHIGLNNIHRRLSILYGKNFKFSIKNNLRDSGTRVELLIPRN